MKSYKKTLAGLAVVLAVLVAPGAQAGTADNNWVDLGGGLFGITGMPDLTGSGTLAGGTQVNLQLTNGAPDAAGLLVVGASRMNIPFRGGLLVPSPDLLTTNGVGTDALGTMSLSGRWPMGLPGGVPYYFQIWLLDPVGVRGFAASNALAGFTP